MNKWKKIDLKLLLQLTHTITQHGHQINNKTLWIICFNMKGSEIWWKLKSTSAKMVSKKPPSHHKQVVNYDKIDALVALSVKSFSRVNSTIKMWRKNTLTLHYANEGRTNPNDWIDREHQNRNQKMIEKMTNDLESGHKKYHQEIMRIGNI